MEDTVLISYAGGYGEIRLTNNGINIKLEHLDIGEEMGYFTGPRKPVQTYENSADAWLAVGKELGWIK